MKVALLGLEYFGRSLKEQLAAVGVEAYLGSELMGDGVSGTAWRSLRKVDVVHLLKGRLSLRHHWSLIARRPVLVHWSGTDVVHSLNEKGARGALHRWMLRHLVTACVADSELLAEEVEPMLGYRPEVIRLLPSGLKGTVLPLPVKFTVFGSWRPGHEELYGSETILAMARAFPGVDFIVGIDTIPTSGDWPTNLTFRRFDEPMAELWPRVSCLVRVCAHDSLSATVLEALSRGRYCIYSNSFPHTETARNVDEAKAALARLVSMREPNVAGARYVDENFDPEREVAKLVRVYDRIRRHRAASCG